MQCKSVIVYLDVPDANDPSTVNTFEQYRTDIPDGQNVSVILQVKDSGTRRIHELTAPGTYTIAIE